MKLFISDYSYVYRFKNYQIIPLIRETVKKPIEVTQNVKKYSNKNLYFRNEFGDNEKQ